MHLTQERLKYLLDYNQELGIFTWKIAPSNFVKVGAFAGSPNSDGYLQVKIDGNHYYVSRLVWFYCKGSWPTDKLDHIDQNKINNKLDNLREVTQSENGMNRTKPSNNTSGYKGVCFDRANKKWKAQIGRRGLQRSLGYFSTKEEASVAYIKAANLLHGNFVSI